MLFRKDWLTRSIKLLADMLLRVAGLRAKGEFEEALRATQDTEEILGAPRRVLDVLDNPSVMRMLAEPHQRDAYAKLLLADAETLHLMGRDDESEELKRRAGELRA